MSKDLGIKIFENNIIYRLIDEYKEWCWKRKEREIQEKLEKVSRPVRLKSLSGCIFRASKPCIFGVEILAGVLKSGVTLKLENGKIVGKVKEIEREGQKIPEAKRGDKVAISMDEPVAGRTFEENNVMVSDLREDEKKTLRELRDKLTEDEKELLEVL